MTYNEYIQNIIDTRGQWNIEEGKYWEGHHIIPKCKGGLGSKRSKHENIIWLYPREHFIAHKLLAEENKDDMSLVSAYSMMAFPTSKTQNRYELTPEEYEEARIFCNLAQSRHKKGKPSGRVGWHHSEETRKKLSDAKLGKKPWNKGLKYTLNLTDDQRKNKSNSAKEMWKRPEYREKSIKARVGKKQTEEMRKLHSEAAKGNTNVRGKHWYNNGEYSIRAFECPEGFKLGRIDSRNKINDEQYSVEL